MGSAVSNQVHTINRNKNKISKDTKQVKGEEQKQPKKDHHHEKGETKEAKDVPKSNDMKFSSEEPYKHNNNIIKLENPETDTSPLPCVSTSTDHLIKQQIKDLELELAKACSKNLDLEDEVQNLKEFIDNTTTDVSEEKVADTDTAENDIKSRDEQIVKLEQEIELFNAESQKLRIKFKRKLKLVNSKLNEAQQAAQIQRMEATEEINQLKENNADLSIQLQKYKRNVASNDESDNSTSVPSDRTNLVVELSAQVSEQCQTIADLRSELADKLQEIDSLKSQCAINGDSVPIKNSQTDQCWASKGQIIASDPPGLKQNKQKRKKLYKIGQRRCLDNPQDAQLAFIKTVKDASSDSESDWENDMVSNKIHSAPAGIRTQLTCQ